MANNSNDASVQSSWVLNLSASQKIKVFRIDIEKQKPKQP